MLPNKMKISENATNSLRRFQNNTGLTVNIGSRLAFFKSIERGFRFNPENDHTEHNGRELDKHTWLGEHASLIEMLLVQIYPTLNHKERYTAWINHVENGCSIIDGKKSLASIL
jgi:DNA sulfur modification protein DndE